MPRIAKEKVEETAKEKEVPVGATIAALKVLKLHVSIKGLTPLLMHSFSQKARLQILQDQLGIGVNKRKPRDPVRDLCESFYFLNPTVKHDIYKKIVTSPYWKAQLKSIAAGKDEWEEDGITKFFKGVSIGFPSSGFKKCFVSSVRNMKREKIKMTDVRQLLFVVPDNLPGRTDSEYTIIKHNTILFKMDYVKLTGNKADVRFRPFFPDWSADLTILYDASNANPDQICTLIETGGRFVGIGDHRPERNGINGTFEMVKRK